MQHLVSDILPHVPPFVSFSAAALREVALALGLDGAHDLELCAAAATRQPEDGQLLRGVGVAPRKAREEEGVRPDE